MSKQQNSANEHRRAQKRSQAFADRAHQTLVETQKRQSNREVSFAQGALAFLQTEVNTGLTLARIAAEADSSETRARNRMHARHAYDSVIRYLGTAADADREALQALDQKIAKLRDQLQSLGEVL